MDDAVTMQKADEEIAPVETVVALQHGGGGVPIRSVPGTRRKIYVTQDGRVFRRRGHAALAVYRPVAASGHPPRVRVQHGGKVRRLYVHKLIDSAWGSDIALAYVEAIEA